MSSRRRSRTEYLGRRRLRDPEAYREAMRARGMRQRTRAPPPVVPQMSATEYNLTKKKKKRRRGRFNLFQQRAEIDYSAQLSQIIQLLFLMWMVPRR